MGKDKKFNFKTYLSKGNLFSNWQIILISCSFLIIFSIFASYKTDIFFKVWEITNNDLAFINYIEENENNNSKINYVDNAIKLLAEMNTETGFNAFDKIYRSDSTSLSIKNKLLDIYLLNPSKKMKTDSLYNDLLLGKLDTHKLVKLIGMSPNKELEIIVINKLKDYTMKNNWDEMLEYIENHRRYDLRKIDDLESIFEELTLLKKDNDSLELIDKDLIDIKTQLANSEKEHTKLVSEIENKKNKRDEELIYFEEIEYEYNMFSTKWELDFYVIALVNEKDNINHYEICPARYDYYGNKYVSMDRANLYTRDTIYSTKGWANLGVINGGTEDIRIKEELGNFIQEWPVYIESSLFEDTLGKNSFELYDSSKKAYLKAEDDYKYALTKRDILQNSIKDLQNTTKTLVSKYEKDRDIHLENSIKTQHRIRERLEVSTDSIQSAQNNMISTEDKKELNLYLDEIISGLENELDGGINNMPYNGLKFFKSYFLQVCKSGSIDISDEKNINKLIQEIEYIIELYENKTISQIQKAIGLTKDIQSIFETYP